MKILYTGALQQGEVQFNPDLSLGGHVSSSDIPNDVLSNIFSGASMLSIQNKKREVKIIALKNNEEEAENLIFTFIKDTTSICKYKIAFVTPTIVKGKSCFEKISNSAALPLYATFQEVINGTQLTVAQLKENAYLGIWIMREYDYTSTGLKKKTCDDWAALLENSVEPVEEERFSFTLNYSLDHSNSSS